MSKELTVNDLPPLATAINEAHAAVEQAFTAGLGHAIRCGELLFKAKALVPHGDWLPWLTQNCTVSERSAQGYMRVFNRQDELAGAKAQRVADLSFREALRLLAAPETEPETEPAVETIDAKNFDFGIPVHPLNAVFPLIGGDDLLSIIESIRQHGLICPIVLHEGQIVDGKIRLLACREAGVKPRFVQWRDIYEGTGTLADWIWSVNMVRQHLTPDQKTILDIEVQEYCRGDSAATEATTWQGN